MASQVHLFKWNQGPSQGKYRRRLYCDHVTKCFVSKCVIQVASVLLCSLILYRRYLVDTFKDKAFQSHDHNTGGADTCPVLSGTLLENPTLCGTEISQNGTLAVRAYAYCHQWECPPPRCSWMLDETLEGNYLLNLINTSDICMVLIGKHSFKGTNRGILTLFGFTIGEPWSPP